MKSNKKDAPIRKLIVNERGHCTITIPKDFMRIMGAKKGDKFKFFYQPKPKDLDSFNTITIIWLGCDAN